MFKHIIVKLLKARIQKVLKAVNRKSSITLKEIRISYNNSGRQKTVIDGFNMLGGKSLFSQKSIPSENTLKEKKKKKGKEKITSDQQKQNLLPVDPQ